jgi:hypothetical protein
MGFALELAAGVALRAVMVGSLSDENENVSFEK